MTREARETHETRVSETRETCDDIVGFSTVHATLYHTTHVNRYTSVLQYLMGRHKHFL